MPLLGKDGPWIFVRRDAVYFDFIIGAFVGIGFVFDLNGKN
jgi:hypothetical protein